MSVTSSEQPACDDKTLQRTLSQLLAHGGAFNQFAQFCLAQATLSDGRLDPDRLFDGLDALLSTPGAPRLDNFVADLAPLAWLERWFRQVQPGAAQGPGAVSPDDLDGFLEWQRATVDCQKHWSELVRAARNAFRLRLEKRPAGPASLMDLYSTWVDAYESVYARMLRSAGFVRDHTRLLNAGVALVNRSRRQLSTAAATLGFPEPDEFDRLMQELAELRRRSQGQSHGDAP